MKAVNKILLVAGAALAAWYVPTLLAIYNLTFDIIAVVPTGANESKISFLVTVRLKNNTGVRVNMQHIKADIILNGLKVAQFSQAETAVKLKKQPAQLKKALSDDFSEFNSMIDSLPNNETDRQKMIDQLESFLVQYPDWNFEVGESKKIVSVVQDGQRDEIIYNTIYDYRVLHPTIESNHFFCKL
ncbi:MAG: hypothetical protein WCK78_11100 [Paludibacter sp.]